MITSTHSRRRSQEGTSRAIPPADQAQQRRQRQVKTGLHEEIDQVHQRDGRRRQRDHEKQWFRRFTIAPPQHERADRPDNTREPEAAQCFPTA